jgi:hypothetical protein
MKHIFWKIIMITYQIKIQKISIIMACATKTVLNLNILILFL